MLLTSVASFLVPIVSWLSGDSSSRHNELQATDDPVVLQFELRHLHAASSSTAHVIFSDVSPQALKTLSSNTSGSTKSSYSVRSRLGKTFRPSSFAAHERARLRSLRFGENEWLDWDEEEIIGPDVESRETLLELAKMTNNAYVDPEDPAWYDLGDGWNAVNPFFFFFGLPGYILTVYSQSYPFGWEPDSDGFRGHVFATPDNSTVIISIKGTSAGFFGGGGPTTKKDKLNDNLLFSCCCARIDWTWTTVCGCYRGGWKCDQTCLQDALASESLFYPIGTVCYIFFIIFCWSPPLTLFVF
jgi:lipase ATG15